MKGFIVCSCILITIICSVNTTIAFDAKQPALIVESEKVSEKGNILIGKGRLIFEPELTYTHISANRVDITGFTVIPSIVIGLIQVEKIKRDIFIPSVTFKYGITDSIQFDLSIPYFIRTDKYITGVEPTRRENTVDETGIGDIEGTLSFHVIREKESVPDVLATVNVKSDSGKDPYDLSSERIQGILIPKNLPTGSGHWAVEPGIGLIKSIDPVVLFGNVSYFWHIKRDIDDIGSVDPGDSVNYNLGFGYALNDKVAVSTAYEQKFFSSTKVDGEKQLETDITVANLLFGTFYSINNKISLSFTLSIGLTPESSDIEVSLKMPINVL